MTKWFESVKNGFNLEKCRCMAPFDRIYITPTPKDGLTKEVADSFDAIINVSHSPEVLFESSRPDQRTYWYPVNECGEWSYAYFSYIFTILDFHYEKGHKILLHCHAGAYRSPSIVRQWLRYKGYSMEEAYNIAAGRISTFENDSFKEFCLNQNKKLGNLPPNFDQYLINLRERSKLDHNYISSIYQKNGTMLSWRPEILAHGDFFWYRIQNEIPVVREYYAFKRYLKTIRENIEYVLKGLEKNKKSECMYSIDPATKGIALLFRKIREQFHKFYNLP